MIFTARLNHAVNQEYVVTIRPIYEEAIACREYAGGNYSTGSDPVLVTNIIETEIQQHEIETP